MGWYLAYLMMLVLSSKILYWPEVKVVLVKEGEEAEDVESCSSCQPVCLINIEY